MNERFVAVSTVMGFRICGWFFKPICDKFIAFSLPVTVDLIA